MAVDVTVVIATRDRRPELSRSLAHLEGWPVVVVDNGSGDGSAGAARASGPDVRVVPLPANLGAAARTVGVRLATTPYVAFADDDSWWAPGALQRAALRLRAEPDIGLIAGRVLVGPEQAVDPVSDLMAAGPLDGRGRRRVTGFLACAAVVRRAAFLAVGGFEPAFGIGSEEELVAADLAAAGWALVYDDEVVAHHHPSASRDVAERRARMARNAALTAALRWSPVAVGRRSAALLSGPSGSRRGVRSALGALPWAAAHRRRAPGAVQRAFLGA